ncbi:MAG: hypothetical protein PHQ40_00425 [Anaerolineaceae bacterium]|nr:hypothetical protein [Anaerolineaceae bacterium]MDD5367521.1 hypothetical protein [Anaerolineaceae bacterium]
MDDQVNWIEDLKKVSLKPGDILVVKPAVQLPEAAQQRMKVMFSSIFPGHKVLVLEPGLELGVISGEETP